MTAPLERPKVGIALLVVKNDHVLMGRRMNAHGDGEWAVPGGHLENGESFEYCALRELAEECGPYIKVTVPHFLCLTNLRAYLPKHYADIAMVSYWRFGDPVVPEEERHKCGEWHWHPLDALPAPRFATIDNLVIAYRTGQPYFA